MTKKIKIILIVCCSLLFLIFAFFFLGTAQPAEKINWGVIFSTKYARAMGLDWQENYLAILDDLKAKHLKIVAYWDLVEKEKDNYNFEELDWQISEAEQRGARLVLVIGQKVPRWPECHIPQWAEALTEKERQEELLAFIETIVLRYKESPALQYWQVENEPFFSFGECPDFDKDFFKKELDLVRQLDKREIIISESGELPLWIKPALLGDIVGHTLYRKVWVEELNIYFTYPFPPIFYSRKAWLIEKIFDKKVICVELQAEPWGPELFYNLSLAEQEKTMNPEQFNKNIEFARHTGIDTFYLWGSEWWYWLKEEKNQDRIWQRAKQLFI